MLIKTDKSELEISKEANVYLGLWVPARFLKNGPTLMIMQRPSWTRYRSEPRS